ncbi:nuclear transport factor 2 family protein [Aeromicrobium terrae]|uniref:Transporter n=1 Tax=Aeromicrobium terrae TaxID=2498846 RepID=A0A5C8NPJ8_9ACTN|nr:nuclear transport factor 2 family protein [Aeromicrobium terrae]TXL62761.1 transporter [Aeromicrobium terrae]
MIDELLSAVARSPELVAAHDREGWVGLFADDFRVDDPVGSRPVVPEGGPDPKASLRRFWDTFIAPNDIRFEVHHEVPRDDHVVRDVTIRTQMPQGIEVVTPAHLKYEFRRRDDGLEITHMSAFWELLPVLRQSIHPTAAHVRALSAQQARMLRVQGVGGVLGFASAMRGSVGRRGKLAVLDLLANAQRGDRTALDRLGGVAPVATDKVIAAGRFVTATVTVDGTPGLLYATFSPRTRAIREIDVYV